MNFFGGGEGVLKKKKKEKEINVAIVGFNLPFDDSKSLSFYRQTAVGR